MFGISFAGGSLSHCFPWLPFDGLSAPWEWKCQRLVAPLSRLVLFIADKHSLISFRDGVEGWGVSCYRCRWSRAEWIGAFIITLTGGALSQRSQQLFWKPFLLRSQFNNRTTSFVDLDCEQYCKFAEMKTLIHIKVLSIQRFTNFIFDNNLCLKVTYYISSLLFLSRIHLERLCMINYHKKTRPISIKQHI